MANQHPARAADHAEQALALRGVGGEWMRGKMLTVLGHALTAMGQHDRARVCWKDALALFAEAGVPEAEETRSLLGPPPSPRRSAARRRVMPDRAGPAA